jgi:hypothetical protein
LFAGDGYRLRKAYALLHYGTMAPAVKRQLIDLTGKTKAIGLAPDGLRSNVSNDRRLHADLI